MRHTPGTLQQQMWDGLEDVRQMRNDPCFAPDAWVTTWDAHNDAVLAVVRKSGERSLRGLFNFSDQPQTAWLDSYQDVVLPQAVELEPYEAMTL